MLIVSERGFAVVGIETRTTNQREMSGQGTIPIQWERLFREGILQQIPDKTDSAIVAVYSDYESDHTGEYSYLLGARVSKDSAIAPGMVAKLVPAGRYVRFTSAIGPLARVVPDAWLDILRLAHDQLGGERTYRADFEVYDERAADPANGQVDVFVGIR